jgi:predicted nucleotidyltransferase
VITVIDIRVWTQQFLQALKETFADRIWFAGLQGSYGRGEATENSDIDMVVILDELSATDVQRYNAMLDTLPCRERMCGFLSGKTEIMNWEPSDLFQLYFDTTPLLGSLDILRPLLDAQAVNTAIKMGACNIYHGCIHNMLYGKSERTLRGLYKNAIFVVQAICFRQTGEYIRHQTELLEKAQPQEQAIVQTFLAMKQGSDFDFEAESSRLFTWCQKWINA